MDKESRIKRLKELMETPESEFMLLETPEVKQLKNIAIALRGIQKELEHLNRSLRK